MHMYMDVLVYAPPRVRPRVWLCEHASADARLSSVCTHARACMHACMHGERAPSTFSPGVTTDHLVSVLSIRMYIYIHICKYMCICMCVYIYIHR